MGKRILVIDDEEDTRLYLTSFFADLGYSVSSACDGEEGLRRLREDRPDLVTLDLMMPNKSGIKMFRELRKDPELGATPVLMITGFTTDMNILMDFQRFLGQRNVRQPEGYLEKPIDRELLMKTVARVLGGEKQGD
jgi:CheY-like chemotaxis protein